MLWVDAHMIKFLDLELTCSILSHRGMEMRSTKEWTVGFYPHYTYNDYI